MDSKPGARGGQTTQHPAFSTAFELAQLLDTGLDQETLNILLELLDTGVNPEALATVVKELRREAAEYNAATARSRSAAGAAAPVASAHQRQ